MLLSDKQIYNQVNWNYRCQQTENRYQHKILGMFGEIATFFSFICLKAPGFFSVTVLRFLHGLIYFLSIDSQKDIDLLNTL